MASAELYKKTLDICLADRNVDGVLTVCSPQAVTDPAAIAKEVVNCQIHSGKTILACWMGEQDVNAGREILEAGNIPNYRYPEAAVDVFMKMYHYGNNLKMLHAEKL